MKSIALCVPPSAAVGSANSGSSSTPVTTSSVSVLTVDEGQPLLKTATEAFEVNAGEKQDIVGGLLKPNHMFGLSAIWPRNWRITKRTWLT